MRTGDKVEREKPRILVVDDEECVRQAVCRWFGMRGFETDEASDGFEALAKCAATTVDVVTMDIEMPGMGGTEAIALLRDECPSLCIVVLTGYVGNRNESWRARVNGAFVKPISLKKLEEEVRLLLQLPAR